MITLYSSRQDYIQIHTKMGEKCLVLSIFLLPNFIEDSFSFSSNWCINNILCISWAPTGTWEVGFPLSQVSGLTLLLPAVDQTDFATSFQLLCSPLIIPAPIALFHYIKPGIQHNLIVGNVHSKIHQNEYLLSVSRTVGLVSELGTRKKMRTCCSLVWLSSPLFP